MNKPLGHMTADTLTASAQSTGQGHRIGDTQTGRALAGKVSDVEAKCRLKTRSRQPQPGKVKWATEANRQSPSPTKSRKGGASILGAKTGKRLDAPKINNPPASSSSKTVWSEPEGNSIPLVRTLSKPTPVKLAEPHEIPPASQRLTLKTNEQGDTKQPGLDREETQVSSARQPIIDQGQGFREPLLMDALNDKADQGQSPIESQRPTALVSEITAVYRRYEDLRRAKNRIELQAIATCRNVCGGDKVAGMKLYKSPTIQVAVWLAPYEAAMAPLNAAIAEHEKLLTKLAKQLPVAKWAESVRGLSYRWLASIIGECGIGPGEYRSVSALWKRMGLAVINGSRQRRVMGDEALLHGYVARRRSLMWNIGEQVAVRQGIRNPKDEDGNSTGAVAISPWGELYLERKAYELSRELTPIHAHNRAKRYVEKRLLRELWKAWRQTNFTPNTSAISSDA